MDLIIRAIIAIFEALFEEDAKKRRPPKSKQGQKAPPRTLEEYKRELEKAARQARQQQQQKAKPMAPARQSTPPAPKTPPMPTYAASQVVSIEQAQRDSRHHTDQAYDVDFSNQRMEQSPEEQAQAKVDRDLAAFRIPGQTETEKLIWAQTILGPCKAHLKMGVRRRT